MKNLWIADAVIIALLHILSPLLREKAEKISGYVALILHIPLFVFLLLAGEKLEVVAIILTLSLFVYIVANTLIPFVKKTMLNKEYPTPRVTENEDIPPENISEEGKENDI